LIPADYYDWAQSYLFKETKIVSAWQTGNRKPRGFEESEKEFQIRKCPSLCNGKNGDQTEDVICTYCKVKFSEDVQGEIWVQCVMCEDWCHEECAGVDQDEFICDYCLYDQQDAILENKMFISMLKTTVGSYFSIIFSNFSRYSLV
jgi:hypothetical protein